MLVAKIVAPRGVVESTTYCFETGAEVMFAQGALEYTLEKAEAAGGKTFVPDDPLNWKQVSADNLRGLGDELDLRRNGLAVPSAMDGVEPYLAGDWSRLLQQVLGRVDSDCLQAAQMNERSISPSLEAGTILLDNAIVGAEMAAKMAGSKAIKAFMQAGRWTRAIKDFTKTDPEFSNVTLEWLRKDEYPVYPLIKATAQKSLDC